MTRIDEFGDVDIRSNEMEEGKKQMKAYSTNYTGVSYPELTGTEKQVAWAKKLRGDMLNTYQDKLTGMAYHRGLLKGITDDEMYANAASKGKTDEQIKAAIISVKQKYQDLVDKLNHAKTNTSAKWFIDNRI